jgi:hypothetical protein
LGVTAMDFSPFVALHNNDSISQMQDLLCSATKPSPCLTAEGRKGWQKPDYSPFT